LFYLQPAELLKVSLPMMVAWYLHQMPLPPRFNTVLVAAVIIGVPTGLVMLQPDFGTAVLIAASGVFVLLWPGCRGGGSSPGCGGCRRAGGRADGLVLLLRPYQKDRIMMFRDPENDPLGAGWNIIQSKIAIGSGGSSGKGWGEGSSRT
jgi:rod shape determining protein RodA